MAWPSDDDCIPEAGGSSARSMNASSKLTIRTSWPRWRRTSRCSPRSAGPADETDEALGRPLTLAYSVRRGDGRAHHRVHPVDPLIRPGRHDPQGQLLVERGGGQRLPPLLHLGAPTRHYLGVDVSRKEFGDDPVQLGHRTGACARSLLSDAARSAEVLKRFCRKKRLVLPVRFGPCGVLECHGDTVRGRTPHRLPHATPHVCLRLLRLPYGNDEATVAH